MRIGVPKEVKTHEYRVGLVPAACANCVHHGHEVVVETRRRRRHRLSTTPTTARRRDGSPQRRRGLRRGRDDRQGEGAAAGRDRRCCAPASCSSPISISPPTRRRPRGCCDVGRDLHRLRDGDRRARRAAAAGADERGRRPDVDSGRRALPREGAGRTGMLLGGVPGVPRGEGGRHRRRRRRHQCRAHGDGRRGVRHHHRHFAAPAARARHAVRRRAAHALLDHAKPSRTRCWRPISSSAPCWCRAPRRRNSSPRNGEADEEGLGDRRRRHRPGRLLRDLAADHARRPDLHRGRRRPLLRGQHAGRGGAHLHLRAEQRDAAFRPGAGRQGAGARPFRTISICVAVSTFTRVPSLSRPWRRTSRCPSSRPSWRWPEGRCQARFG